MKEKVRFRDLSFPAKVGVVGGWAFAVYFVGLFLLGFLIGLVEIYFGL